jgi:hypothetical protein
VDIAERHHKPLIFVINGATPRARITGEAAIALSQHGTVAPVMLHHRVDYAASMVDGRTVGEVVPKSTSAKEVSELWVYVRDRLSRLTKEIREVPEFIPQDSESLVLPELETDEVDAGKSLEPVDVAHVVPVVSAPPSVPAYPSATAGDEAWRNPQQLAHVAVNEGGLQTFGKRRVERLIQSR